MPRIRIIAGDLRGRFIDAPNSDSTRPTTNRVREAVMSSVFSLQGTFEGTCVLDAFAGSGAMGFEAISRGASHVVFCDEDSKVCATIERNASILKIPRDDFQVMKRNVISFGLPAAECRYDIVFLDPPYKIEVNQVFELIEQGMRSDIFDEDCLFVYEHDASVDVEAIECSANREDHLRIITEKTYGKTKVTYLRFER